MGCGTAVTGITGSARAHHVDQPAFVVDAATFVVSALFLVTIHIPRARPAATSLEKSCRAAY